MRTKPSASDASLHEMATTSSSNGATVTITMNGDQEEESVPGDALWEGILGVEGLATDDGRYLIPGQISERDLPLPLMAQFVNEEGHTGSEPAGKITEIWRNPNSDLGPDAVEIWGRGIFDTGEAGIEAARLVEEEILRGVSLDMSIIEAQAIDPETLEVIEEFDLVQMLSGDYLTGITGKIGGATLCSFPAFEQASLRVLPDGDGQVLVASTFQMCVRRMALTAAAGAAPLAPPKDWFDIPEPNHPTPLTVTDDGRVFGHLATWNQCHASFPEKCELAPKSRSGYKYFHVGSLLTAEGETVRVGRLTVGKPNSKGGGHNWNLYTGAKGAIEHYDRTGSVAAFVRAKDGKHGIWLSGATRSDAPEEAIRDLRANPPSGDWRFEDGGLELVAALAVPVPGFPVPYLMASAGDQVTALIMPPNFSQEKERARATREEQRRMTMLASKGREALAATKTCMVCGKQSPMSAKACLACGKKFSAEAEELASDKACASCGSQIPMGAKTCPECGADQTVMSDSHYSADEIEALQTSTEITPTEDVSLETHSVPDASVFAYTAEQRRKMAKSGEALPDGSFPIANCSDAEAAIHAQGRATDQAKAVAHIKKRVSSLGCSGSIFENYK